MRSFKKEGAGLRLLCLSLTAVLAVLFLLPSQAKREEEGSDGGFVLLLSEVEEVLQPHLHVGDRVIDRQSRSILGDITDIRTEPSLREIFSEEKKALVLAAVPERCDILLTLGASRRDGMVFTADGAPIRLGQTYHFCTYDFTGTGRVVELI